VALERFGGVEMASTKQLEIFESPQPKLEEVEQPGTVRGFRLCPLCGEVLPDGADFCDELCRTTWGTPKPDADSLALFAGQMRNYEHMVAILNNVIVEAQESTEAAQRRYEGVQKRRFRGATLEETIAKRKQASMDGQDSVHRKNGQNIRNARTSASEIIRSATEERRRIVDTMQWIRINHNCEAFDYDEYLSKDLPLPADRAHIYGVEAGWSWVEEPYMEEEWDDEPADFMPGMD
jgi:hypothetical protein